MSSSSQRTASLEGHGYPLDDSNRRSFSVDPSRSVSPPPQTNNPYRNSMAQAIEEAKRLSINTQDLSAKSISAQDVERQEDGIASKATSTKSQDENEKDSKRPKTTMFALPEEANEEALEKKDAAVGEIMKKDLKIKFRIRMAKAFLRCINFGCSLVVLSLIANSFSIFFATRNLPSRNNLPPWAPTSVLWPTYVTLAIACLSLFTAVCVLYSYWRGGHRRAERAAIWFTAISIGSFLFMIILWAVTASVITSARNNSDGKDLWAWSCKDNERKQLFSSTIDYDLVCRQMDWSFVCSIIEIIVETLSILLYAAAFWRFAHKSKLRKSMEVRDKVRETIYLQKLKEGDMSVYRPEYDLQHEEQGMDLNALEKGFGGIKQEFRQSSFYPTTTTDPSNPYPAVPVPSYAVGQPIIDPNSGLAIDPHTGAASKPVYY